MTGREAPPPYEATAEVLDRARALFRQADRELTRGLAQGAFDEDNTGRLYRANLLFNGVRAAAALARELLIQEDEQRAEEFERHLDDDPSPLGYPPAKVLDAVRKRTTDTTVEPRHPFLRQQPASNTHCRWIVSTGRSCNQPPTDPIHQEATDGS